MDLEMSAIVLSAEAGHGCLPPLDVYILVQGLSQWKCAAPCRFMYTEQTGIDSSKQFNTPWLGSPDPLLRTGAHHAPSGDWTMQV